MYRLAKVCGAYIAFDPVSHIYYRQHGDNVCGMEACRAPHVSVKNMFHNAHHQIQNMMRDLCDAAQDAIAPEARRYIDWVLSYNHKPSAALHLALDRQAFRRGPKLYIAWIVKLLVHRL